MIKGNCNTLIIASYDLSLAETEQININTYHLLVLVAEWSVPSNTNEN